MDLTAPTLHVRDVAELAAIAAQRSAKPEARAIFLDATSSGLRMHAITPEVTIETTLADAEVEMPGKALVNAIRFYNSLCRAEAEKVAISVEGHQCVVQHGGARHEMATGLTDLYDQPPPEEIAETITAMPIEDFLEMLRRTKFAVSKQPGLWAQHSVLIEFSEEEDYARMVATDGRRLATVLLKSGGFRQARIPILPQALFLVEKYAKLLESSNKKLPEDERPEELGLVHVILEGKRLVLEIENTRISAMVAQQEFPEWEAVMPKAYKHKARVDRKQLLDAVKEATSLGSSKDTTAVRLTFENSVVTLKSAGTIDAWASEVNVQLEGNMKGGPVTIALSPTSLRDGLTAAAANMVAFEISETGRSVVMKETVTPAMEFVYVMMPVLV